MNIRQAVLRVFIFASLVGLANASSAATASAQDQAACPTAYGAYYKAPDGWKKLRVETWKSGSAKQPAGTWVQGAGPALRVADHRPTFCIRQPVGTVGTAETPEPIALVKLDSKSGGARTRAGGDSAVRGYTEDQVVQTRMSRADEEGMFSITPTAEIPMGEYLVVVGTKNPRAYQFGVR